MRWYRSIDNWFRMLTLLLSALALLLASLFIYGPGFSVSTRGIRINDWSAFLMNAFNVFAGTFLVYWCAKMEFNLWPRVPIIVSLVMIPAWLIVDQNPVRAHDSMGLYFSPFILACIALAGPYIYSSIDESEGGSM